MGFYCDDNHLYSNVCAHVLHLLEYGEVFNCEVEPCIQRVEMLYLFNLLSRIVHRLLNYRKLKSQLRIVSTVISKYIHLATV